VPDPPARAATSARPAAQAAALPGAASRRLARLAKSLEDLLDDEAAELPTGDRARIEGALRGLDRRARMTLPAWRSMLQGLQDDPDGEGDPDFVDWFSATVAYGRVMDAALRRHWVDPTAPLAAAVLAPAHGVLITSATLTDPAGDDLFALAEARTGSARLPEPPKLLRLTSPFDYAANSRAFVVTDVGRDDPRQVAAAMRELFLAAGGGALGLFTAVRRLAPSTSASPPPWPKRALRSTPSTSTRSTPARSPTSSAPRRTAACSAPTPSATAWTSPAARSACSASTASPGLARTSCTRPAAPASASAPTTTPWPAPASPKPSAA
jgi:Rad3-related DNA helicase